MKSKQTQRKVHDGNNTWSEQEDALFGPSSTPVYCEPCIDTALKDPKSSATKATLDQKRKVSLPALAKKLAGNASSRVTSIISKAKGEVSKVSQHSRPPPNAESSSRMKGPPTKTPPHKSNVKDGEQFSKPSQPSFITPALFGNSGSDTFRNVRNAVLSQAPHLCAHCRALPMRFQHHPFFGPTERICSTHPLESVTCCVSCFRFQPKNQPFQPIGTSSAKICPACARTAILDDNAARRLYENVLSFMECQGLDMFQGRMLNIPIHLVGENGMNEQSSSIGCNANEKKRGLTIWSEVHAGLPSVSGIAEGITKAVSSTFLRPMSKKSNTSESDNKNIQRNAWAGMRHVSVKKILCLKGLPENLMASILAHEATHAWLAFNPIRRDGVRGEKTSFGQVRRIDQTVEEGLCQLVSYLYLQHLTADDKQGLSDMMKTITSADISDSTLNQYYKWSIENHSSPVYGGGFKKAARAYAQIIDSGGELKDLFQYISMHRDFPPV